MQPTIVNINLKIKFRAFGITFYTLDKQWKVPLIIGQSLLSYSDRGVTLAVDTIDAPTN